MIRSSAPEPDPTVVAEAEAAGKPTPDRFAQNKIFTTDKVAAARARLRAKLQSQVSAGFDPEILLDGITIGGAYIEAGLRDFASFAKVMVDDLGEGIRPYLKAIYNGVRDYPGVETEGMTPHAEVDRLHAEATVPTIEGEAPNVTQQQPGGVVEPGGEGLGGGAPEVPQGAQPAPVPEPEPVGEPGGTPPGDRGERGGEGEPPAGPGTPRDEPPAVHGAGEGVTKPPAVGPGDNQARPDSLTSAGITDARKSIEERSRSNYRITPEDAIGQGTPKEKVRANIEAVRVLKQLEDEGRGATPEEKAKLVKYTGWGAFAQDMFLERKGAFKEERDAFRALVTDEEYNAARASTLNAHYTSPEVVAGIWDAITHFGFKGGMALEPSAGVGHFIGMIPDSVAPRTAWTAVELDSLTGRIAKALYGGAEVNIQGFETLKRPSNYYDLVVSNVPFGDYKLTEKPYGSHSIHDFFFVKSLDKVRPGGVVAFVTSRYTMDRVDPAVRRILAQSADLVGAIRLPGGRKGAFASNAGTEVTTDILFLRKRAQNEPPFEGGNWMDLKEIQTPDGPVKVNEYFADRPDMMLGEMRLQGTMYRADEPVLVGDSEGLREKIAAAAAKMPPGAFTPRASPPPPMIPASEMVQGVKDGGFFAKDGTIYRRVAGIGVPHILGAEAAKRVTRLIGLRDLTNDLLAAQIAADHTRADSLRADLRRAYDEFVAQHGPINKETTTVTKRLDKEGNPVVITRLPNIAEFRGDPDAAKVMALELYDQETGLATRAPIQERTVISPPTERQINGPGDALTASLDTHGRVDIEEIGKLLGAKDENEAIGRLGDLIYQNPDGRQWETADNYLSGDVVKKLEDAKAIARSDPTFLRNVEALEKVQPTPLTATDIVAQFGAPWIPTEVYEDFLRSIGVNKPEVAPRYGGGFKVAARQSSGATQVKYGTEYVSAADVIDAALNNRKITVKDKHSDGSETVNVAATDEANVKVNALKEEFSGDFETGVEGWVWADPERAQLLEGIYNRTYNNLVPRKFDGAHQTFPGMSADLKLRPHQADAVWRTVQNGNTLLAHVVGAGKTYTMIASGMEQKRLGLITKPAYVVPNHMLEQFSREFLQAYPTARILVASKEEMSRDARQVFVAKVAANDWDGVVITHDAFGRIGVSAKLRREFIEDQLAELERAIEAEIVESGRKSPTVKDMEKARKKLEERLKTLLNEERKDEGTTFEESGIDHLFVDEAHLFKNLAFTTRLQRVKGLSQGNSQRAEDLYMKMRYLEQKRPGRAGVFATGTPVSNTMAELWTMMRYLEYDKLKERGLENFDSWANTFGKISTQMELSADARTLKESTSFSKFVNVPELISLYGEIADTKTADMLKLPRPDVVRAPTQTPWGRARGERGITIVQAEPSIDEEAYIQSLVELAERLKGKRPAKGEPNMLSVVMEGRKVATDGRLINPAGYLFNPEGKIALAVDRISDIYKTGTEPGMAQLVFLDLGVPNKRAARRRARPDEPEIITADDDNPLQAEVSRFDLYNDLKGRLVEKGIPSDEIAFIHDADTDDKKAKLFRKVRAGDVRVLVGSTSKMGVGTNVQDRLIAMHHLDAPWKPAEVEQRDGRIVRQGNLNPEVQIYRYITKRSFDAFMWQKLDTKSKFIGQVLSGAKGMRHAEDIDSPLPEAAEMKAAASGDPRIMEHAELTRQVRQLQSQKRAFETTVSRARWGVNAVRSRIKEYETTLPTASADGAKVQDLSGDKFTVELDGQPFTERKAAGEKMLEAILAQDPRSLRGPTVMELGKLSGFDMGVELKPAWGNDGVYLQGVLKLTGAADYSSPNAFTLNAQTDPAGLVRRFENMLAAVRTEAERLKAQLIEAQAQERTLATQAAATWPRAQELANTSRKLQELSEALKQPAPQEIRAEPSEEIRAEPGDEDQYLRGQRQTPMPGETRRDPDVGVPRPGDWSPQQELALKSLQQRSEAAAQALGFPLRQGRIGNVPSDVHGMYKTASGVVRVRELADYAVVSHEGGHALAARSQELRDLIDTHEIELGALDYDADRASRSEGFAEWFRMRLDNPAYARRQAPNFANDFEAFMLREHPDTLKAIDDLAAAHRAWREAPSLDAVGAVTRHTIEDGTDSRGILKKAKDLPKTTNTVLQNAYTKWIDRIAPMQFAEREMDRIKAAQTGTVVEKLAAYEPSHLMRSFRRAGQTAHAELIHGIIPFHAAESTGASVNGALNKALGKPFLARWNEAVIEDFDKYLNARMAEYLWRRFDDGLIPNEPHPIKPGDARQAIAELERKYPTFREGAEMLQEFIQNMRQKKLDAGLWSQETFDLTSAFEFYMPMRRVVEPTTGGGGSARTGESIASGVRKLRGSERDVESPLRSLMRAVLQMEQDIRMNEIRKAWLAQAESIGYEGGRFAERLPAHEARKYTAPLQELIEKQAEKVGLTPDETRTMIDSLKGGEDVELMGEYFRMERKAAAGEPIVFIWEDGKPVPVRVMSEKVDEAFRIYELMTETPQPILDTWVALTGTAANALRSGVIFAPEFVLVNFIRDQLQVALTRPGYIPFLSGIPGLVSELRQDKTAVMRAAVGGVVGGSLVGELERGFDTGIQSMAKKNYLAQRLGSWAELVANPSVGNFKHAVRDMLEMLQVTEAATRNSVFGKVQEQKMRQGLSPYEAMMEAGREADDIMDFSRHGDRMSAIRRMIPFMNANMQGQDKYLWRTMVQPFVDRIREGQFVTTRDQENFNRAIYAWMVGAGGGIAFGMAWAALNWSKDVYRDADPDVMAKHFVLPLGNGDSFLIPKPFEMGIAFTTGEMLYANLVEKDPRAAERLTASTLAALSVPNPIHDIPGVKTWLQLETNQSFFTHRTIVPDQLQNRQHPELEYNERTSTLARQLGKTFGISPMKVDFAVGDLFGTNGRYFMQLSTLADQDTPATALDDVMFIKRFIKDNERISGRTKQFWDYMAVKSGRYNQDAQTYRRLVGDAVKAGQPPVQAQKLLNSLPGPERAYVILHEGATQQGRPAFSAEDRRMHPLTRAHEAVTILNAVARDLQTNTLVPYRATLPMKINPEQRRKLIDEIRTLAGAEMRNAFVITKEPGYADRQIFDPQDFMDRIRRISPNVADEIATRYAAGKVYTTHALRQVWPAMEKELNRYGTDARIGGEAAAARAQGFEFSGTRVKKPGPVRQPIAPQPVPATP